ncbi:hypothetical protein H6G97_13935 [Nostoc flagelliforme FACHB-838]|uniref:Uncharacterized protein n=1 Tax=Nostoc flagelliforme FACHB-838 TaxID=2692904 RepID=A0ABR8DMC3_9NOSO|nr:hypothetical protein [Nostoc flagelliforme FACHB-838]
MYLVLLYSLIILFVLTALALAIAIPLDTYRSFFTLELPRLLIQRYQVRLIVFDPEEEAIIIWQK